MDMIECVVIQTDSEDSDTVCKATSEVVGVPVTVWYFLTFLTARMFVMLNYSVGLDKTWSNTMRLP